MADKTKSFIAYIDDDGVSREAYVDLLELNSNFVKFATAKNIITIPIARLIKLKEGKAEIG